MNNYEHFVTVVAGENPNDLMATHQKKSNNEKYIKYYYKDAGIMKAQHLQMAKAFLENTESEYEKMELEDIIDILENQTIDEFWEDLSEDYETDDENNIITDESPEEKISSFNIGNKMSMPFKLKNGETTFQARKSDIDWDAIHFHDYDMYIRTWELAVDGETPLNDTEEKIKKNMSNMHTYFNFFKNKEIYASHCSAFWGYAFLNENNEWHELTYEKNQIEWVLNYYDNFIAPLPDNTLLTIFECRK